MEYGSGNRKVVIDAFHKLVLPNFASKCEVSQNGNRFDDLFIGKISQLNFLEVTGVVKRKSFLKCSYSGFSSLTYFYLGKYNGDYYVHKKIRLRNPLIWLREDEGLFSIFILAGFYPCSNRVKDVPNVKVELGSYASVTMMKSPLKSNIDFYQTWPHHYLTDHGEWSGSAYLLQLESQMKVSENHKFLKIDFRNDTFDGLVKDGEMTIKSNQTSKPIICNGDYTFKNNDWSASLILKNEHNWKQFFTEFFPTHLPFHPKIQIASDFKTKLINIIENLKVSLNFKFFLHGFPK